MMAPLPASGRPRDGSRRDAILRLIDGTLTPVQIAAQTGVSRGYVYRIAQQFGRADKLSRPRHTPPMPPDLVLRDLHLPPDVARWLIAQTENGALIQDVIRGVLTDAFQEEKDR